MTEYALRISEPEVRRYLMMAEHARAHEADAWREAGFVAGAAVADVGCGPGAVLAVLAGVVAPGGTVIGVERDEGSAGRADQLLETSGHGEVQVLRAPAHATGIPEASLDAVMLRHVLIHNAVDDESTGVPAILRHLASLVRPGGHVYVADTDLTARRMVPPNAALAERSERYHALLRSRRCDPQIGVRLGPLLKAAGLDAIRHDGWWVRLGPAEITGITPPDQVAGDAMIADGLATPDDVRRWNDAHDRHRAGNPDLTFWIPAFRAIGRRPA